MSENKAPGTFCALAWVHSFVNIGGEYQICCSADEFSPGIDDGSGKVFNIQNRPSIDAVMNSEYMKSIRAKMMKGEWSKDCLRCLESEKLGGRSRRQIENDRYTPYISSLVKMTKPDMSIDVDIKYADYRLGNLCNLQCRMCNPRSTKMWIKEWNKSKNPVFGENFPDKDLEEFKSYDWMNSQILLDEFMEKVKTMDTLHFAGGEPLITDQMAQMLKICVDQDVAKNILLTYNTNLTKIPERILELWKNFKEVRLLVSVDGFDKVNDYIRMPVKWNIIEKNLRFLDENAETYKISEILLSTTVQAYNILSLTDLYDHLKTYKMVDRALNLVNLYTPVYMRTQILPDDIKAQAASRLLKLKDDLLKSLPDHKKYHAYNIDQVIAFMNEERSVELLPEFKRFTKEVDLLKNLKCEDYLPELTHALGLSEGSHVARKA